jgi:hypothetical protein
MGKTIKLDLKTPDWSLASLKVEKLNNRFSAEWDGLRSNPDSSPKNVFTIF